MIEKLGKYLNPIFGEEQADRIGPLDSEPGEDEDDYWEDVDEDDWDEIDYEDEEDYF